MLLMSVKILKCCMKYGVFELGKYDSEVEKRVFCQEVQNKFFLLLMRVTKLMNPLTVVDRSKFVYSTIYQRLYNSEINFPSD